MDVLKKTPVREQDAKVRATNFEEVCYGYNKEEAMEEASRCLKCKNNAKCMGGCPVSINIPGFIKEVEAGNFEAAANVIAESSALQYVAVCARRRASVRANASAESRVSQSPSASWSVSWLTGPEKTVLFRRQRRRKTARRLPLSVPALLV